MKRIPLILILIGSLFFASACERTCETCSYGAWETTKEATCTEEGSAKRTCSVCNNEETKTIEKTSHSLSFKETKTAAGCVTNGVDIWACANCAFTEEKAVTAKGHSFGAWEEEVPASCTNDGRQAKTCKDCGEKETKPIQKTGHRFTYKTTVPATCTTTGKNLATCSVCNYSEEGIIPLSSHEYTAATCEKAETCKKCGAIGSYARGHRWMNATCTKPSTCSVCKKTTGSPAGHSFSNGTCRSCGEKATIELTLPSTPKTLSYYGYNNKKISSCKITKITSETTTRYDETIKLTLTFIGELTYHKDGSNQSDNACISYKLYDSDDFVVKSGTAYSVSVKVGEKFKEEITIYDLIPGEKYKLVIQNTN